MNEKITIKLLETKYKSLEAHNAQEQRFNLLIYGFSWIKVAEKDE